MTLKDRVILYSIYTISTAVSASVVYGLFLLVRMATR